MEFLVESLGRKAHHVVERAVQSGDANVADPFLDSVGSGLVERLEVVDVVVYLTVGQILEIDIGSYGEGLCPMTVTDCRPESRLSILTASALSWGLPRISVPHSTIVSEVTRISSASSFL